MWKGRLPTGICVCGSLCRCICIHWKHSLHVLLCVYLGQTAAAFVHWYTVLGVLAWLYLCPCVGEVVRGDSMQSDSSGYADEELSFSSDRHGRWWNPKLSINNIQSSVFSLVELFLPLHRGFTTVKDLESASSHATKRLCHIRNLQKLYTESIRFLILHKHIKQSKQA